MLDVVIVGGSAAGLSAATVLGRARRDVVVLDHGAPRNSPATGVHGFLSRDGTPPSELRAIAREQLTAYPSVAIRSNAAVDVTRTGEGFAVQLDDGTTLQARRLLLATGVRDELPPVPGMAERWGSSVFHCPYCHGWEVRDEPLAVYGRGQQVYDFVQLIRGWSRDLVLCTDGPAELTDDQRAALRRNEVELREERIARLEGAGTGLERIVFDEGAPLERSGIFVHARQSQRSDLPAKLGCATLGEGLMAHLLKVDMLGQTSVPGAYAAGDSATFQQQVVGAAATGAMAAAAINRELAQADWR